MKRALIVDDKEENAYYLVALLKAHGYEVDTARHGAEALVKARQNCPDLVVSDLLMPVMDGYTLLRHWKADARLRNIPFVVYTATYTEPSDERLALDLGADAFVLKPTEPDAFLSRIEAVRAKSGAQAAGPRQVSGSPQGNLEGYTETLIRKLEEKTLQLEEANRALQRDIADRELAQKALRESEAQFRLLTEAMPQLVWMATGEGKNLFVNQRWVDYTGIAAEAGEGDGWLAPLHEDDRPRARAAQESTHGGEGNFALEVRLQKRDGTYHWWLMRGVALRDDAGGVVKWFGTFTDIDRLKEASAARDHAERIASERAAVRDALFDSVPDVVIHVALDGTIEHINQVPGPLTPEAVRGASWLSFAPAHQHALMQRAFDSVVSSGQATSFESSASEASGTSTAYWNRIAPVVRDGRITGAVVVARDITERKQTEAQLIVSDRMASVGTLAAGVAHEINNPLASVTANLALAVQDVEALARTTALPQDLLDELHDARDGAERVRMIVRDLKIFSRSEDDKRGPVDVEHVLESTVRMAWNELRHRARLVKLYGKVPPVEANESRLGQVFLNLIVNAAQAIPEGNYDTNEVRIETTAPTKDRVVVTVTDTGTGIPPEVQRRMFTPFLTTKPVGVGTGLGLSICHRIVTALGGNIEFTSAVGKGTTFRVSLPVAKLFTAPDSVRPTTKPETARKRGTVLAIDDESMMTHLVARILSPEHDVTTAASAQEALQLFRAGRRFDVVLCDLMMPQVTGMDLHAALMQLDAAQASRVVFMTGGAFTPSARTFLDAVPNQRVEKPFDVQGLRAMIGLLVAES